MAEDEDVLKRRATGKGFDLIIDGPFTSIPSTFQQPHVQLKTIAPCKLHASRYFFFSAPITQSTQRGVCWVELVCGAAWLA